MPSNGPTVPAVRHSASGEENTLGFKIVDIDLQNVNTPPERNDIGLLQLQAMSAMPLPAHSDQIRKGDVLTISVFEVGVTLFGGGASSAALGGDIHAPTAGAQTMTAQVRDDGTISLPYIGTLRADDADPAILEQRIRERLRPLSQSPQVQVGITQSVQSVAYLSGAISRPGRIPLTAAHERLLDVLAIAGGAQSTTAGADSLDLDVHLVRGDKAVSVRLGDLRPEDMANLVIMPGDRIELRRAARTFTVFGATDHVAQIPFSAEKVTLAEAIARASGPSDARANARGVFLFRFERDSAGKMKAPIVYHIDMMKPQSYFLAQMFEMQDKDVILFANSRASLAQKLAAMLGNLFSPATALIYAAKN
ncbi:MAG: polysaccharide biosynthesis/export family protein [Sphingomonadales bacterium]|nr:polysaccharide biosynthesis/export family protein [Sphingomonadales bacterium]MDE2171518.1 polysaccharide biosynthesis/export family protein [Sphingomonadales bacterium]